MIVGININSIKAKTNIDKVQGNVAINSSPTIVEVDKRDVGDLKDILIIKFFFRVDYNPDAGEIKMEGEVLYKTDNTKNIIKKWKEEKKLESDLAVEVLNAIFRRCLVKSVELSGDLRLPPPVRFPTVEKEEKAKGDE